MNQINLTGQIAKGIAKDKYKIELSHGAARVIEARSRGLLLQCREERDLTAVMRTVHTIEALGLGITITVKNER